MVALCVPLFSALSGYRGSRRPVDPVGSCIMRLRHSLRQATRRAARYCEVPICARCRKQQNSRSKGKLRFSAEQMTPIVCLFLCFKSLLSDERFSVHLAQPTNPVGKWGGGREPAPNYVPSDGPSFFYRYEIGVFNGTNGTGYPSMTMFTS